MKKKIIIGILTTIISVSAIGAFIFIKNNNTKPKEVVKTESQVNTEVRDELVKIAKDSFEGVATVEIEKESDGLNVIKITQKGMYDNYLNGRNTKEYSEMIDKYINLSSIVSETAKNIGSNEEYAIAVMNDTNEGKVLELFIDGKSFNS